LIKVKVFAPAFISHENITSDNQVALDDGATLNDLCGKLKLPLPLRLLSLFYVNYEQTRINTKLDDGDVVSFLFPISGG
jgi:molybdopterin converting factor small subunit